MKSSGLVILVSALLLVGCATRQSPRLGDTSPSPAPGSRPSQREANIPAIRELEGSSWILVELRGAPAPVPPEGWSVLSLEFGREGVRANGNAGVNRFVSRYTQDGQGLVLGPLALTRRLGPPDWMEAEQNYTRTLSRVVAWRQEGAQLVLMTPRDTRAAVFERAPVTNRR
jgi:heat shock protein HslJ